MKRILVGVDGSPRAAGVLATATAIARAQGAKLTLVRAVGLPPEVPENFWKTTDEPLLALLERHAKEELDAQATAVPAELAGERYAGIELETSHAVTMSAGGCARVAAAMVPFLESLAEL